MDSGVDISARLDGIPPGFGKPPALLCLEMAVVSISPEKWGNLTVDELNAALDGIPLKGQTHMDFAYDHSATFLFRTREGGQGILQLVEFTDDPRAIKIRYKLLRADSSGSDYPRALRELKSAMPTLEALENTLEQKDLESALTLANTALRQMQTYNIYVDQTAFEISQGVLNVFSLGIEALKAGNLERANTLFESSMNSVDIDLPEKLEAFVNRNSTSPAVQNE
jgi:hypothetical protein